ncbi:MAG: hypothetical protein Q8P82_00865 [bacterium]|nr:hypothetical protein [bacterium]
MKIVEYPADEEIRALDAEAKRSLAMHLDECAGCEALVDEFQIDPDDVAAMNWDTLSATEFSALPHSIQVMHVVIDIVMEGTSVDQEEEEALEEFVRARDAHDQEVIEAVQAFVQAFPEMEPARWDLVSVPAVQLFQSVHAIRSLIDRHRRRAKSDHFWYSISDRGEVWMHGFRKFGRDVLAKEIQTIVGVDAAQAMSLCLWAVRAIRLHPALLTGYRFERYAGSDIQFIYAGEEVAAASLDAWRLPTVN